MECYAGLMLTQLRWDEIWCDCTAVRHVSGVVFTLLDLALSVASEAKSSQRAAEGLLRSTGLLVLHQLEDMCAFLCLDYNSCSDLVLGSKRETDVHRQNASLYDNYHHDVFFGKTYMLLCGVILQCKMNIHKQVATSHVAHLTHKIERRQGQICIFRLTQKQLWHLLKSILVVFLNLEC